ncbi:hypothetical protein [Salininema proteolyticum]|uniref:Uncharacterized protein n=1 Tax=Salininema proteolyticum TaxID=1607685 RepID=A0ABV8TSZ7_9ACTN
MNDLHTEPAAQRSWDTATRDTFWEVTGHADHVGPFEHCLARVQPAYVTGVDHPVFELLTYAATEPRLVEPSSITHARELILVEADNPTRAYYIGDQATIRHRTAMGDTDHTTKGDHQ